MKEGKNNTLACPHCNTVATKGRLQRWHFDKCKCKELNEEEKKVVIEKREAKRRRRLAANARDGRITIRYKDYVEELKKQRAHQ